MIQSFMSSKNLAILLNVKSLSFSLASWLKIPKTCTKEKSREF